MKVALAAMALGCAFWLGSATTSHDGLTGDDLEKACDVLSYESLNAVNYTACMDTTRTLRDTREEYRR